MRHTGRSGYAVPTGVAMIGAMRRALAPVLLAVFALGGAAADTDRPVTVMNDIGQPLEGASLFETPAGATRVARGKSGPEGLLTIPRTPPAQSVFRLEHAGYAAVALTGAELGRKEELILVRCATLSGAVRDTAPGAALKGAKVEVLRRADGHLLAEAVPDARGRFIAPDLEPGAVRIRARAAGTLVTVLEASLAPGGAETVDLPLARPVQLRAAPEGVPADTKLSGVRAEVRKGAGFPRNVTFLLPADPGQPGSTALNALPQVRDAEKDRSEVTLSVPSGVPLELRFRADGFFPARRVFVARNAAETVRVPLARGASVSGRLVDAGGRAVAGVTVRARYLDPGVAELIDWDGAKPAPSGDDGAFRIGALPPGSLTLELADSDWILPRLAPIRLEAAGEDLGTIALRASAAILGRVVRHSNGAPVAGAKVRGCLQDLGCAWTAGTRTDKNGSFRLTGIAGGTWNLEASHPDYPTARVDGLVPGSGAALIELPDGGSLRGRVLGPDGAPLRRVRVRFLAPDAALRADFERTVDTDEGRFEIAAVPPGRTTLVLRAPGFGPLRLESVEVRDGEPTDLGNLAFFAGRVARGRVVRTDDSPVAGAGVTVRGDDPGDAAGATSDSDGRFEVAGLPDDAFDLVFQAAGLAPAVVAYAAAGSTDSLELSERTVKLREGGTVEGSVRGENDEVVGGARLRLPAFAEVDPAVTDAQGRYRLEHVPAGDVTVQLIADPAAPEGWTESRRIAVPDGGTARLDFLAGGSLDGSVRRRGQPVPFARISAVAAGGVPLVHTAESGPDGTFRLHGITDGTWTIHVAGADCLARFAFVSAPGSQERRLELELPPDDLAGWVLNESNGDPIASADVAWSDAAAADDVISYRMPVPSDAGGVVVLEDRPVAGASAKSLSDGSFRLCVPAAGALEVEATAGKSYDDAFANLTLPAREPLTLKLPPKGDEVRVVVLRPDGTRASTDAGVALIHRDGFYEIAPAGAGGEAKFTRPKSDFRVCAAISFVGLGLSDWVAESTELTEPIQVAVPAGGFLAVRGLEALRERAAAAGTELEIRLITPEGDDLYLWGDALGVLETRRVAPDEELVGPFPLGRYTLSTFIGPDPAASARVELTARPATVDLTPGR